MPDCLGSLKELKNWLKQNNPDCIVFSESTNKNNNMRELIDVLGNTCSRVIFAPNWSVKNMRFRIEFIGEQNCVEIWGSKQSYDERILKRLFELTLTIV